MKLHILYGSATGNAEHIAKDLASSINDKTTSSSFTTAECLEMDQFKKKKLFEGWATPPNPPTTATQSTQTKHALILISSTTGNGDAPENASRFVRFVKRKPPATLSARPLEHVAYAVLGLGDTNYDQFCAVGKLLDRKLEEWGGVRAYPLGAADEATGLESVVEPWLDGVLVGLANACLSNETDNRDEEKCDATDTETKAEIATETSDKENNDIQKDNNSAIDATTSSLSNKLDEKLVVSEPIPQCSTPKKITEHSKSNETGNNATALNTTSSSKAPSTVPSATPAASSAASSSSNSTSNPTSSSNGSSPTLKANNTASKSNNTNIKSPSPLYILYGSATGNSEHIAKDLASSYETLLQNPNTSTPSSSPYFPSVVCCPLNDYKKKCLSQWEKPPDASTDQKHGIILICSTTGNANAPENADRFVRWLKRKSTPSDSFQHCAYAVLGLGDSNYDVFCAMGKLLDKRLGELGGTKAMEAALADEATGLEETVEPWVEGVIGRLVVVCAGSAGLTGSDSEKQSNVDVSAEEIIPNILPQSLPMRNESSLTSTEEKKMEHDEATPVATTAATVSSTSVGVSTIRNLLSISPHDPLPSIPPTSLPSMVSSLSSCELITDNGGNGQANSTNLASLGAKAETMTVSSASSGFHYTLSRPYESQILNARYLTNTSVECAMKVSQLITSNGNSNEDGDDTPNPLSDEKLIQAMELFEQHFPLGPSNPNSNASTTVTADENLIYDKNGKRVIELTLSLPDDFTLEYEPGDSVGLIVPNTPQSTNFILDMLHKHHGISASQLVAVDDNHPITVGEAIRTSIDLCSVVKKKRLYLLSQFATDVEERRALELLCSTSGSSDLFRTYAEEQNRTIIDILKEFPSCQSITLEGLLGCLPAIPPRYYSICSSPLEEREELEGQQYHLKVAFSVVDYLTPSNQKDPHSHRRIGGLATRYLECLSSPFLSRTPSSTPINFKPPTLQIFPKPTHEFRLPPSLSTPLILIGPGTGIAPFLGFLSHRHSQVSSLSSTKSAEVASQGTWRGGYELEPEELKINHGDTRGLNLAVDYMRNCMEKGEMGEIDLFFGCRYEGHDWLYKEEVEDFQKKGIVKNYYVGFSREVRRKKRYVQDVMVEEEGCGDRIVDMIVNKNASVYICGDGTSMGRDVQLAITKLLADKKYGAGEGDEKQAMGKAESYVEQMKTFGRFVLDIWS